MILTETSYKESRVKRLIITSFQHTARRSVIEAALVIPPRHSEFLLL